jgi:hypothetical protein
MTDFNIVKMNENRIRPQKMVGAVIINGGIHTHLCSRARSKAAPYYPAASGIYGNNQNAVVQGDLVFTLMRPTVGMAIQPSNQNAIRVLGVAVLNGHGDDQDDGNEILMQEINVWGIAEVPETPNTQGFFNIIRGGILTVRNNSKWTIQAGDYVQAYAPTREELKDGGSGKECDAYGQATLWLAPYDAAKHSLTLKPVYRALKAKREGKTQGYLKPYLKTCDMLVDSICDMSVVVMGTCFKKLRREFTTNINRYPESGGEIAFMTEMINHLKRDDKKPNPQREEIIDRLSVPYSGAAKLFEPGKVADVRTSPINRCQKECLDRFFRQSAILHHYVHKNVIGQAVTTGERGRDFSFQFKNYAR